ncbi:hypothetical protein AVEN_148933-1, partial [Araneus ventricosus]
MASTCSRPPDGLGGFNVPPLCRADILLKRLLICEEVMYLK